MLASPLMLLTMLAIKLEDGMRAPVLYGQVRVGYANRNFRVLKFRSMRIDAEKNGARSGPRPMTIASLAWAAFIRKMRIDELPQLFNVLQRPDELRRPAARAAGVRAAAERAAFLIMT